MKFRLTYRGPLPSSNKNHAKEVHALRQHFRPQLKVLWDTGPLKEFGERITPKGPEDTHICLLHSVGDYIFAPIVSGTYGWNAVADLNILFLRPSEPGKLIGHGGDIDNRIKTLFDALRAPKLNEIPFGETPKPDEIPFHCLLEDDALVTGFNVVTDRLLTPCAADYVELILQVNVETTRRCMANDPIW